MDGPRSAAHDGRGRQGWPLMQAINRGAAGRDVLLTGRRMRCGAPLLMDPGLYSTTAPWRGLMRGRASVARSRTVVSAV